MDQGNTQDAGAAKPVPDFKPQAQPSEPQSDRAMPSLSAEQEEKAWRAAQKVIQAMLDENIMFSQRHKVEKLVRIMIENIVTAMMFNDLEEIFDRVYASLEQSMRYANEFVWGKSFSKVTMEDLDEKIREHFQSDPDSADRIVEEGRDVLKETAEKADEPTSEAGSDAPKA